MGGQRNATPENIVAAHGGGACAAEAAAAPGEGAAPTTANETFFIATLFFWGFSICRKSVGKQEKNGWGKRASKTLFLQIARV